MHIGKRLAEIRKKILFNKVFSLNEVISLIKSNATAKFDETIDIVIMLGVAKKTDQNIRSAIVLPHGTGKKYVIAVFAKGQKAEEAKNAGADFVGADDLVEMVQAGKIPFDRCVATPDMMSLVGKIGKILGPKGLMPNPKLGTVTIDIAQAVKNIKNGQIEFRTEKNGIIHAGIGKASFSEDALAENIKTIIDAVLKLKPVGTKGIFLKEMYLSSTMGVGVAFANG